MLLLLVAGSRLLVQRVVHIYDDAFITYRYATNLALGHGLIYQPGAEWEPVLGTTTPGYAVWLALWVALGGSAPRASLITNVLCDVLSAYLLLRSLRERPLSGTLAVLGFACMPELARISGGGMESPMLLTVVLASACAWSAQRVALAAILTVIACTLRPESVLLAAFFAWDARRRQCLLRYLGMVLGLGALVAGAAWLYYGNPIPQSVVAKASRHAGVHVLARWNEILAQALLPRSAYAPALILVVVGSVVVWRERGPLASLQRFALGIIVSYLAARPHTWGWYYYLPLVAWVVAAAVGSEWMLHQLPQWRKLERWVTQAPLLLAPLALVGAMLLTLRGEDRVRARVYEPLNAWAREVHLERGQDAVLASDIGALGYYGRGRVLDSEGLVWPAAVAYRGSQVELIREYRPRYLLLTATLQKLGALRADPMLTSDYQPTRRFSVSGASELEPKTEELSTRWVQDYILYERRRDLR